MIPSTLSTYHIPYVWEKNGRGEKQWDVFSRLLNDRIIFLGTPIDDGVANAIIAQLLFLQMEDSKKDIAMYIHSPGGYVTAGLAIYDTMQFMSCDVCTYCIGQAASMGAVLLTAGAKGKRNALPHARVMIHQPMAGTEGTTTEILIHAKEFLRTKRTLNALLAKHSGQPLKVIEEGTDRDNFIYHEMLAHPVLYSHPAPKRVLIIGSLAVARARPTSVSKRRPAARWLPIRSAERRSRRVSSRFGACGEVKEK